MKTVTLLLILLCAGCVTAKYNPETKEVSYTRIGDQKLGGIIIESYPDGRIDVLIESQQSEARLMQDAIGFFRQGIEEGRR